MSKNITCDHCRNIQIRDQGSMTVCVRCQHVVIHDPKPEAVKHDLDKPMMGLISTIFTLGLAKVLTFGAKKYAAHNWRKGFVLSRPYDALQRHLNAFWSGEDLDPETGLSHLDHAACEMMFLRELWEKRPDLDDRYKVADQVPPHA